MTTIVYCRKSRTMASDRRVISDSGLVCHPVTKIGRAKDGALLAVSGGIAGLSILKTWWESGSAGLIPEMGGCDACVVKPDGSVWWLQQSVLTVCEDEFIVLGSGGKVAIGALAAGASAKEAVEIASRFDIYTGDGVNTLILGGD